MNEIQEAKQQAEERRKLELRANYGEHLLQDSLERLKFQHEYTIAGFKTLTLINGGAILALLTYAGNGASVDANNLSISFMAYAVGLALCSVAYLFAYSSQGSFMNDSTIGGIEHAGLEVREGDKKDYQNQGKYSHGAAVLSAVGSLASFVIGSYFAMQAVILL